MITQSSDPRIVSPDIKVVYPSDALEKADSTEPTDLPVAQSLPTQPQQYQPAPETVVASTDQTTQNNTVNPAAAALTNWKEVIQQNATLFLMVGIAALAIGFVIGKKI